MPVLLMWLALVIWFGFQTLQLLQERGNLAMLSANQQATYENAVRMRTQLDAIAGGTQRLAESGNRNAALIIDQFRQRGVTFSTSKGNVSAER